MSKVLKISKHKLDLASVELTSPSLLIGRSPLCDQVLRAPDILPVHFLLEWIGEGEFNPKSGMWTLFDIGAFLQNLGESDEDLDLDNMSTEGYLISKDLNYLGLQWSLVEDSLKATHLQKGILATQVLSKTEVQSLKKSNKLAVEIVQLSRSDKKVLSVVHFFDQKINLGTYNIKLPFDLDWNRSDVLNIKLLETPKGVFDLKGRRDFNHLKLEMFTQDTLIIHFEEEFYFIRFVSRVEFFKDKRNLFNNSFLIFGLISFILFSLLLFYIKENPIHIVENKDKELRVVKIVEVTPTPEPIIEAPKEEPKVEPKEELKEEPKIEPKEEPKIEPKEVIKEKPKKIIKEKGAIRPLPPKKLPPEKITDIGQTGLFSKLKSSNAKSSGDVVSASNLKARLEIDNTSVKGSAVIQSAENAINVKQIIRDDGDRSGLDKIEGSGKDLKKSVEDTSLSSGPIVSDQGSGESILSMAENIGGGKSKGKGKVGKGKSGDGDITGGLDKAQVLAVINEHRREIRTCYESALMIRNDLNGIVRLNFTINSAGSVSEVKILNSDVDSSILENCIINVIKEMSFPEAKNKMPTTVVYPFVFKRSS